MLYVPVAHGEQARSFTGPPATLTNCPAEQSTHLVHEVASSVELKVPASQALHTRLVTAVPFVASYAPSPQGVQAAQGLAGLAS
jgi:hypothetical protein